MRPDQLEHFGPVGTNTPTNPIPESAVELAARAMWESFPYRGKWPADASRTEQEQFRKMARAALPAIREAVVGEDTKRLDYIERTFSGMTNRERYLPVQMIWGKGCNGRTLREACDKYMARDAAALTEQENRNDQERSHDGG